MNVEPSTNEPKSYQMNRLIIIGNGFDLAHGMKTSFRSFMIWYLSRCLELADKAGTNNGDNSLISVTRNRNFELPGHTPSIKRFAEEYLDTNRKIVARSTDYSTFSNYPQLNPPPFEIKPEPNFMLHLIDNCIPKGWVDIEVEYYKKLKELLNDKKKKLSEGIISLNDTVEILMKSFGEYLNQLPKPQYIEGYTDLFKAKIDKDEIPTLTLKEDIIVAETQFLNFNYTGTVDNYASFCKDVPGNEYKFAINYIHGCLNDDKNPIIFGYGDELDPAYKTIEELQTEGSLKYIKSFWYFRTNKYHDLIRFIESGDFQVYIIGHSCGLSDRTLLSMIFEHEKCKSIKIFHHTYGDKKNNFIELTQNISRQFTNKIMMRNKIVPYNDDAEMLQNNLVIPSQG